ncbi:hypothetical protein NIES39_J00760 [Arthrospira platensis NIES-39]|nr:hypothetical protein NIES39_J00760 [Arthrospira platensis NIES-39]
MITHSLLIIYTKPHSALFTHRYAPISLFRNHLITSQSPSPSLGKGFRVRAMY